MKSTPTKVLVVEDNVDHALLVKACLEEKGLHQICIVHSAEACKTELLKNSFDIILLDYYLPGENGLTVLKNLRDHSSVDVPIVFVTGHGHEKVAIEAMKAGAFDYVIKSVDYLGILPNVITRVLEKYMIFREKKRMEDEVLRQNNELQVLNSISQVLNRSLIPEEILTGAIAKIAESMQLETTGIYLVKSERNALVRVAASDVLNNIGQLEELSINTGEISRLCSANAGDVLLTKRKSTALWNASLFEEGMRACLAVPLIHNKSLVGLFLAASKNEHYFTERRINLFSSICSQLSIAIENANLYLQTNSLKDNLKDVLDSSLDLIVTLDLEGKIRFYNRQFGRVQKDCENIEGTNFLDFIPENQRTKVKNNLKIKAIDRSKMYITDIVTSTRATLQCFITQSRLKGRDELLLVIKDISRITRLQNQVIQSEKLSALGKMIAGAAHELNNPLAGIIGYGQLLLEEDLSVSIRQDIEVILKEAGRCQKIVKKLLTFARKRSSRHLTFDLNKMLETVLDLQNYQLKLDGIQVETELNPNLPLVIADLQQLQQVTLHMIHNAQDALRAGQHTPKILSIETETVDNFVLIRIADNGIGIHPELHDRIFEPFFTTKDVGQGTGLGLSMCHAIIDSHQGKINVKSEPGAGTAFTIELPVSSNSGESTPREVVFGRYASLDF